MFPIRDHNPRRSTPWVNHILIAVNIIVFFFELSPLSNPELWRPFADRWTVIPAQLVAMPGAEFYTIFTAMFLHGSFGHLFGNMLYLWIFGDNIEDQMGHFRYLCFYLLCGFLATAAQVATNPDSQIPNVGASGAIAGVLGGYFLMFPMVRVTAILFYRSVQVPAIIVLGLWFAMQLFSGWSTFGLEDGGVAFWAHIGGFVAGVLLVRIVGRTRRMSEAQIAYLERTE